MKELLIETFKKKKIIKNKKLTHITRVIAYCYDRKMRFIYLIMAFFKVHETMRPVIIWEVQDFFRYTILSRINFCLEVPVGLEVLFCSRMVCVFRGNLPACKVFYP